jgi:hypothetical protein
VLFQGKCQEKARNGSCFGQFAVYYFSAQLVFLAQLVGFGSGLLGIGNLWQSCDIVNMFSNIMLVSIRMWSVVCVNSDHWVSQHV